MAECVTNAEDAAILRHEGVGLLQGHHFGWPSLERPWLVPAPPGPLDALPLAAIKLAATGD